MITIPPGSLLVGPTFDVSLLDLGCYSEVKQSFHCCPDGLEITLTSPGRTTSQVVEWARFVRRFRIRPPGQPSFIPVLDWVAPNNIESFDPQI